MAAWTKRVLVGVVLMAMVAGLTPAASALPAPKAGKAPIVAPKPEAFVPGPVNRAPVGGPVTSKKDQLLGGQAKTKERRENGESCSNAAPRTPRRSTSAAGSWRPPSTTAP